MCAAGAGLQQNSASFLEPGLIDGLNVCSNGMSISNDLEMRIHGQPKLCTTGIASGSCKDVRHFFPILVQVDPAQLAGQTRELSLDVFIRDGTME